VNMCGDGMWELYCLWGDNHSEPASSQEQSTQHNGEGHFSFALVMAVGVETHDGGLQIARMRHRPRLRSQGCTLKGKRWN
jgi:hypothetical protein